MEYLRRLYKEWAGEAAEVCEPLPQSGSNRRYYRMSSRRRRCIGVVGENARENASFLSFTESLRKLKVNVPEVYAAAPEYLIYLQKDLGSTTLYDLVLSEKASNNGKFTKRLKDIYKRCLSRLLFIQGRGRTNIDYSVCYPRDAFDEQSIMWDLQYFKYYFVKLAGISFDDDLLERDFCVFTKFLLETNCRYFLYRDFQSRNIMIDKSDEPWFIDYQGGRRGARQYDVASLLYDAKAAIPSSTRNELLAYYVSQLPERDSNAFVRQFYGYVLVRIMQAMGAYGYRGFFERKSHFLKSIPYALDNLSEVLRLHTPELDIPELKRVWSEIANSQRLREIANPRKVLTVVVSSFSYKKGIPVDTSGNGGGHVFDCRALPNPGREEQYKQSTGRDADVVEFFAHREAEMAPFYEAVTGVLRISIDNYLERGFENLMVSFGCTGGQHRSVYSAEYISRWINKNYPSVVVKTQHLEHPETKETKQ